MLTIVLPTFGREGFTRRFKAHAAKLPFRLLLDEGDFEVPVAEWFARNRDAVARVNTPYALLADNDDIPTLELSRCVEFLQDNPDYVCCSGRIQGFYMWPDLVAGPHSAVTGLYAPYDAPADYGQERVSDRVLAGFANSWSYYAVYRTQVLAQIRDEVCALNLTNLQVHEKFCAMRTLTLGKAYCAPDVTTYYRQYGTSHGPVWQPLFNIEILRVLAVMESLGVKRAALTKACADWFAVRDRYFRGRFRKPLKAAFPGLAWLYQNRHRWLPHEALNV